MKKWFAWMIVLVLSIGNTSAVSAAEVGEVGRKSITYNVSTQTTPEIVNVKVVKGAANGSTGYEGDSAWMCLYSWPIIVTYSDGTESRIEGKYATEEEHEKYGDWYLYEDHFGNIFTAKETGESPYISSENGAHTNEAGDYPAVIKVGEQEFAVIYTVLPYWQKSLIADTERGVLLEKIQNAQPGTTVVTDMSGADFRGKQTLSEDILLAMKSQNVALNVMVDAGIQWRLSAYGIDDENLSHINLLTDRSDVFFFGSLDDTGEYIEDDEWITSINKMIGNRQKEYLYMDYYEKIGPDAQVILTTDQEKDGIKGILFLANEDKETPGWAYLASAIVNNDEVALDIDERGGYMLVYAVNGDINADNEVNIIDLMIVLHHVSERKSLDTLESAIADVNLNDNTNIQDLMKMLHFVSGRTSEL